MAGPTDPRLEEAKRLIQNKQKNEARALLTEILRANPNNTQALYHYARVARDYGEAERVLQRLLKIDPQNAQARAALEKVQQLSVAQLANQLSASAAPPARPAPTSVPKQQQPIKTAAAKPRVAPESKSGSNLM